MFIAGVREAAPATRAARRDAKGMAFVMAGRTDESQAAPAPGAAEPVVLGAMLALQEEESGAARDRQARRHGQAMLEELAMLQCNMLGGTVESGPSAAALVRLAALAEAVPEAADPRLSALIGAIVLRARVELARGQIRSVSGS